MSGPIVEQPLHSPITHAGRVVYNAFRDYLETRDRQSKRGSHIVYNKDTFGEDECHTIQQFELTMRNCEDGYMHWSPNDTDVRVFSSANGIRVDKQQLMNRVAVGLAGARRSDLEDVVFGNTPEGEAIRRAFLRQKISFAGVASNRAIYDPHNNANEEHLAVVVGGLTTIYNTGEQPINAGDTVLWDLPYLEDRGPGQAKFPGVKVAGVPKQKRLFATVPLRLPSTIKNTFSEATNDYRVLEEGNARDINAQDVARIVNHSVKRRVIGRAMSSAVSGQPFDILLGRYMCG